MSERARAVGGPIFTRPVRFFTALFAIGAAMILWRLVAGLGATTALSDGYPWGLWIAFDVVVGTALACGGYAVGLLVYVLNRGRYHPLIRPAILTSALGYTIAGTSVFLDIGKPWIIWKVPLFFWSWNLNSALLEVALCIMSYMFVLWIELSPAFLERLAEGPDSGMTRFARKALPLMDTALLWIMGLGLLLPTMHQSSLGSLMVLSGPKLHPLWWSPLLPLLFLVSCIAMGYAAVVFESTLSTRFYGRRPDTEMLAGLSGAMLPVLGVFLALRIGDLVFRGKLGSAFAFSRFALAFWIEIALMALPLVLLAPKVGRRDPGNLFRAAMSMMLAGAVYRFNTYLVAYRPFDDVHYFPSVPELLITLGLVSLEIVAYVTIVKLFPIIGGAPERAAAHT
jgi:Ni/Fe-hydrogenase subunit HybB-like protein